MENLCSFTPLFCAHQIPLPGKTCDSSVVITLKLYLTTVLTTQSFVMYRKTMYEAQTPVMKLKRKIYDVNNVSIVFSTVTRTS